MKARVVWVVACWYVSITIPLAFVCGFIAIVTGGNEMLTNLAAFFFIPSIFMCIPIGVVAMDSDQPDPLPSRAERRIEREAHLRYVKAQSERKVINLERENERLRNSGY